MRNSQTKVSFCAFNPRGAAVGEANGRLTFGHDILASIARYRPILLGLI